MSGVMNGMIKMKNGIWRYMTVAEVMWYLNRMRTEEKAEETEFECNCGWNS